MKIAQILLAFLFGAKIAWNLCVPYALGIRARRGDRRGTSLMPYLEWALLAVCTGVSSVASGSGWYDDPGTVGLVGSAVIIGSYVHFVLASALVVAVGRLFDAVRRKQG